MVSLSRTHSFRLGNAVRLNRPRSQPILTSRPKGGRMQSTKHSLFLGVVCLVCSGMALVALPTQAQTFAYVTNSSSSSVSVIDTATNTVTTTVGVESRPIGVGFAFTPNGSRVYVANSDSNSVSVIDTATNAVIATIAVGSFPQGLAITPDGSRAYVSNTNSASVIDTATNP